MQRTSLNQLSEDSLVQAVGEDSITYQFDFVFVKCLFLIKADVLKSSGGVLEKKTSLFLTKLFFLSLYLFTLVASFLFYSLGERWQTLRNHNIQNNHTGLVKPSMID